MARRIVTATEVRAKSALTTDYVMASTSIYLDEDNTEDTNQDFSSSGGTADKMWLARKFVPAVTRYVSLASVWLGKTGSPAGTIEAYIYTDDGETISMPDALLSGSGVSDRIDCDDLTLGNGVQETFRWTRGCPFVQAGTSYWLVLQTTGYTYLYANTDVHWRTDADGATGLNECAKYDSDASPAWTSAGANAGADISIDGAVVVPIDGANRLVLYADFTKGDSSGVTMKLEFSDDMVDWYQETDTSVSSGAITVSYAERTVATSGNGRQPPIEVSDKWLRFSAKAVTDATGASVGIATGVGSI